MNVIERAKAPTPKFFKTVRTLGLLFAAAGGALVAAPVAVPVAVATLGSYLVVAGSVMTAVSQVTVVNEQEPKKRKHAAR